MYHLGIYLVRHPRGRREIVISGSAQVAATAVAEMIADDLDVPRERVNPAEYIVSRIGDYEPSVTAPGELLLAHSRPSVAGADASAWIVTQPKEESSVVRGVLRDGLDYEPGSTIATDTGVVIAEQRHVELRTEPTGPECDGPNCDELQHWAGCSLYVQIPGVHGRRNSEGVIGTPVDLDGNPVGQEEG